MALNKITVAVCYDSLKAEFTLQDDLGITDEQAIEELQKGCYNHSFMRFNSDDVSDLSVMLYTVEQFSTFVSWLANTIKEKW